MIRNLRTVMVVAVLGAACGVAVLSAVGAPYQPGSYGNTHVQSFPGAGCSNCAISCDLGLSDCHSECRPFGTAYYNCNTAATFCKMSGTGYVTVCQSSTGTIYTDSQCRFQIGNLFGCNYQDCSN